MSIEQENPTSHPVYHVFRLHKRQTKGKNNRASMYAKRSKIIKQVYSVNVSLLRSVSLRERESERDYSSITEPLTDGVLDENPFGANMSCTGILGTCGTGSLRCVPSGLLMMSVMLGPPCC